jgi:ABC-2 type transport system permease protein
MSATGMALSQLRYENRSFWRNPAAAFFTFVFPLMFLVIFTTIFSGSVRLPTGEEVTTATYYTGSILAFAIVTAAYVNIAIQMTFARDEGILKRVRGTPLPAWAFLGGKVTHAAFVQVLLVSITLAFGYVFYDVQLPTTTAAAFVVTFLIGSAAFASLGLAVTALIPNPDAAPAIVNFSVLPLYFMSGVFIPVADAPRWMTAVADVFPVKHFLEAVLASYLGTTPGGWEFGNLAVVAAWGLAGTALAARFFAWEPRR